MSGSSLQFEVRIVTYSDFMTGHNKEHIVERMTALIKVEEIDARKGRGVLAVVPIAADTEVMTVRPDISVLYTQFVSSMCHQCFTTVVRCQEEELSCGTCKACKKFALCQSCSTEDFWRAHSQPCEWFCSLPRDVQDGESDYLRFLLEYASRIQNGDTRLLLSISSMCTNEDSQSAEVKNFCRSYSKLVVSHFAGRGMLLDVDHLYKVLLQTKSNSVGFPYNEHATLGWSMQEEICMLNHSCTPNVALKVADCGLMQLRTLRDIREGDELFISYIDLDAYSDVAARTRHLLEQYRFLCVCVKCLSERMKA